MADILIVEARFYAHLNDMLIAGARSMGFEVMVGCMVGTSLAMAPAILPAQSAAFVDLDGPAIRERLAIAGPLFGLHTPPILLGSGEDGRLQPAYAGVRPKIVGPGEADADFRIDGPAAHGAPGLVHLYGIESPGLTAALAIGARVAAMC